MYGLRLPSHHSAYFFLAGESPGPSLHALMARICSCPETGRANLCKDQIGQQEDFQILL